MFILSKSDLAKHSTKKYSFKSFFKILLEIKKNFRFALKMSFSIFSNENAGFNEYLELKYVNKIQHENIIKYIEYFVFNGRICILTEYYKVNKFFVVVNL